MSGSKNLQDSLILTLVKNNASLLKRAFFPDPHMGHRHVSKILYVHCNAALVSPLQTRIYHNPAKAGQHALAEWMSRVPFVTDLRCSKTAVVKGIISNIQERRQDFAVFRLWWTCPRQSISLPVTLQRSSMGLVDYALLSTATSLILDRRFIDLFDAALRVRGGGEQRKVSRSPNIAHSGSYQRFNMTSIIRESGKASMRTRTEKTEDAGATLSKDMHENLPRNHSANFQAAANNIPSSDTQQDPSVTPHCAAEAHLASARRSSHNGGGGGGGGGNGRLVLTHSTYIAGLIPVLRRLADVPGIATVVPARMYVNGGRRGGGGGGAAVRLTVATPRGFKLLARHGCQTQEVFVVTSLGRGLVEAALQEALED